MVYYFRDFIDGNNVVSPNQHIPRRVGHFDQTLGKILFQTRIPQNI